MSNYSVMHWSSLSGNLSEVLNFSGHVAPTEVVELPIHKVYHFGSFQPYTKNKQVFFFFLVPIKVLMFECSFTILHMVFSVYLCI